MATLLSSCDAWWEIGYYTKEEDMVMMIATWAQNDDWRSKPFPRVSIYCVSIKIMADSVRILYAGETVEVWDSIGSSLLMGRCLDSVSRSLLVLLAGCFPFMATHHHQWKGGNTSGVVTLTSTKHFFVSSLFLLGNRVYWCGGGVCDTTTSCCEKCVYSTVAVAAVYGKRPSVFREIHDKTDGNKMRCMWL